ncbi:lipid II flippase MurJ [Streptomyces sp. BK239]|uniref:lipid II flippase MurJ n=1 Tax=Streptomyces sp. BK239 TaxID=2512155 RepID=UPI0010EBCF87|nr:lipid II flippase MurJ [Streptomyces sp. BK239]RZU24806.1 putative peptidoglycan lipid II flippase [Streptomyces sp. BK239]
MTVTPPRTPGPHPVAAEAAGSPAGGATAFTVRGGPDGDGEHSGRERAATAAPPVPGGSAPRVEDAPPPGVPTPAPPVPGGSAPRVEGAPPAARADPCPEKPTEPAPPTEDGGTEPELPPASRRFLAKAALVTAVLSVAGALLGLVRDQALARLFGAGRDTDAFLVAWTVPEFAATLLIEDGLAFALIPAFSVALARRAEGTPGDPVRALVAGTLPRLSLAFVAVGALLVGVAPQLVELLAPGLPDPGLAVDCTRLTATCAVSFGLAGYCSAALRAHRRFVAPAAIYVAYNVGIVTGMFVLGGSWGVRSAAAGVAVGGFLMVAVQLPSLIKQLRKRGASGPAGGGGEEPRALGGAVVATVLLFALCRQSQVLVERFLASHLPSGAISHLNYAQKVAQMPMILSVMLCTVTYPVVARALAEGDVERARDRVERDLALAVCVVLLGTAVVVACAPQIIEVLFQRGAFTARDTAATAGVMRVYALGLLGQTMVGVLARSYFSAGRAAWYPFGAMAVGIVVTAWSGVLAVGPWGVYGIAAANAAGITVTALVLLAGAPAGLPGLRSGRHGLPRCVPIRVRPVLGELSRPLRAAALATPAGAFTASRIDGAIPALAAGTLTVTAVFLLVGRALNAQGVDTALRFVRSATRRLPHVRSR